ncbi:MAG: tryptophan--tRNA ligase [Deltaproteobacteria bacterium RIFCSPLOWO2_02_FULL_44_10]|nr:MAG: tryptophan--tRNA ligase [Deltaproteobacteria bacterium RIFCSPHIGHO2_02_FULL_44_16]OGQ47428.1 MAG: tryptophan--tRNA ligase [Deltaproteobacteria bacterium RIFCSPLOWO2_02_FULL_44_10]
MKKERILSGNRPTGKLHWGNYFGAIQQWVELQEKYDCFYFIADWHALTTGYEHSEEIAPSVKECLLDWLAAGIDPKKCTLFLQSWVPEHAELHLLLSMITPLGWLERVPSYKEMKEQLKGTDLNTYGFFGYPVLQTGDIVLYQAKFVPVGEDQVSHIELSREIVRRFHHITKSEVFVEPKPLLTKTPRIPGTDGRKMSKSYGNAIYMADDDKTIETKMMQTITDPGRKRRYDPGNPDICNIYAYHKLYTDAEKVAWIDKECRSGQLGCVECKQICIQNALEFWRPIRQRREQWESQKEKLLDMLRESSKKAQHVAAVTMQLVRKAMGLDYGTSHE